MKKYLCSGNYRLSWEIGYKYKKKNSKINLYVLNTVLAFYY